MAGSINKAIFAALAAAVFASAAHAQSECDTYTNDSREPGEVVAKLDGRSLTVTDRYGTPRVRTYELVTAGTGIPYMLATDPAKPSSTDGFRVLEHKGDLIIDMMVFVPFCQP